METIFSFFLIIHVIGGTVGLIAGFWNMIAKKGDAKHRMVGKVFSISMLGAGLSALVLSVMNPNLFLFMVGIFTVYMVLTGNRYLKLKMLAQNQKPKMMDWTLTMIMLLAGVLLLGLGMRILLNSNAFGLVYLTFGFLGLMFVRQDVTNYSGKSLLLNYWLLEHLQRMTGAFIASSTAFLVVNASYLPASIPIFVYWLVPSLVVTPLIVKWSRKYEVRR